MIREPGDRIGHDLNTGNQVFSFCVLFEGVADTTDRRHEHHPCRDSWSKVHGVVQRAGGHTPPGTRRI
ncbi:uncharacterized protein METZ01_LOCUS124798 [marine metagenome]|uniref:Uncharacterized protein n=1 Tax=marine metagenome TaxID=408172 RepID=A0A381Y4J8_9ZZZZ